MEHHRIRVLLIDDCESDRALIRQHLARVEGQQLDVVCAGSMQEGLAHLKDQSFDVCLVDNCLGSGTGIELIEATANWLDRPPMIVLTGNMDRQTDLNAMRAGAADYLNKQEMTSALLERSIRFAIERAQTTLQIQMINADLREEIERRVALQDELIEVSRQAGMAEVATGVLHSVGNVLNSINISVNVLMERLQTSHVPTLARASDTISKHESDLATFLTTNEQGRRFPEFLKQLVKHLEQDRDKQVSELQSLTENVDHVKQIVATHQSIDVVRGVVETLDLRELLEDALTLSNPEASGQPVTVRRNYDDVSLVICEKHKVAQILVNLISNAIQALAVSDQTEPTMTLTLSADDDTVELQVRDNGVGISSDNLTKIFVHGFTTKVDGHGFGLHSSALAAESLEGSLSVHSDGLGKGATFTLRIPIRSEIPHTITLER